jgi:hypothetical protein
MTRAAEAVAIAGPLVPCMPDWAPEKRAYMVIFEAAVAENILAEDYPQIRNLAAQVLDAGSLVTRVAVLFSTPDGTPLRLFSHDGCVPSAIIACADDGYVLGAVIDPFKEFI